MKTKLISVLLILSMLVIPLLGACSRLPNPSVENTGEEKWNENQPYKIEFFDTDTQDADKCRAAILTNPNYAQEFTVTIPEKAPDGRTVTEVGFKDGTDEGLFMESSNLPEIMPKDLFDKIREKALEIYDEKYFPYRKFMAFYFLVDYEDKKMDDEHRSALLKKYPFATETAFYMLDRNASSHHKEELSAFLTEIGYTEKEYYKDVLEVNKRIEKGEYKNFPKLHFSNGKYITGVELPATIESIGYGAFANCINLKEIKIPEGVKKISDAAFENCKSLTLDSLPESITYIGNEAFLNCSAIEEIDVLGNVFIGDNAFCKEDGSSYAAIYKVNLLGGVSFVGKNFCVKNTLNEYKGGFYLPAGDNPYAVLVMGDYDAEYVNVHADTEVIVPHAFNYNYNGILNVSFENREGWTVYSSANEFKTNMGIVLNYESFDVVLNEELQIIGTPIHLQHADKTWICNK